MQIIYLTFMNIYENIKKIWFNNGGVPKKSIISQQLLIIDYYNRYQISLDLGLSFHGQDMHNSLFA